MRLIFAAIIFALLADASASDDKASASKPPEISDKLQKEFYEELAAYHSINADLQGAKAAAEKDERMLEEQRKKVAAKKDELSKACGAGWKLDEEQFRKGAMTCVKAEAPKDAGAKATKAEPK